MQPSDDDEYEPETRKAKISKPDRARKKLSHHHGPKKPVKSRDPSSNAEDNSDNASKTTDQEMDVDLVEDAQIREYPPFQGPKWQIERLLAKRKSRMPTANGEKQLEFLTKWIHMDIMKSTWLPAEYLDANLISVYSDNIPVVSKKAENISDEEAESEPQEPARKRSRQEHGLSPIGASYKSFPGSSSDGKSTVIPTKKLTMKISRKSFQTLPVKKTAVRTATSHLVYVKSPAGIYKRCYAERHSKSEEQDEDETNADSDVADTNASYHESQSDNDDDDDDEVSDENLDEADEHSDERNGASENGLASDYESEAECSSHGGM